MFSVNIMKLLIAETGDERKIRVEYEPDGKWTIVDSHVTFSNNEGGKAAPQYFETLKWLDWYVVVVNWKPYLVATGLLDTLAMSSSKGAKKQNRIIKKINKTLYSCKSIKAKGDVMTISKYFQMPEWWKREVGECHIASDSNSDRIYYAHDGRIEPVSENVVSLKIPVIVKIPEQVDVNIDLVQIGEERAITRRFKEIKRKCLFKRKTKT